MTFNDILHKFRSESFTQKDKGTQFERLMRSWLLSDPRYSNLTKVWLWDDFPSRADLGGKDTGIDLVARTEEGDYWAIQCKCYKEDSVIDKPAVDSFLATSSRQFKDPETLQTTSFAKRMWISTTNHWGKNAEDAIQNQNPPFNRVGLVDLQNSPVDWQLLIDGLKGKEAMLPGKQPREHQLRAMSAAHAYFQEHDRGKLIMACGTGKTYTALKIAEDLLNNKGLVLFMVPSISLLGQSLNAWCADAVNPIKGICICSDSRASRKIKKDFDDTQDSVVDLAVPATTNPKSIAKQLKLYRNHNGLTVVFSTYQSIEAIHAAQHEILKETAGTYGKFDLIVCDEAHRTTGVKLSDRDESNFTKIHDAEYIKGNKRLYMTATPRLYGQSAKIKASEKDAILCSMDDPKLYGEEFFRVNFSYAVEHGLLTDYKVLVLTVNEDDLPDNILSDIGFSYSKAFFCMQWGRNFPESEHAGILFVGRATNGWITDEEDIDVLFGNTADRIFNRDDQMQWVENSEGNNNGYNSRRSAFWRVIKRVSEYYYPEDWSSYIAWSNVCKVAPFNGGNPNNELYYAQLETCLKILEIEIEQLSPRIIVFLTGENWVQDFLSYLNHENYDQAIECKSWGEYKSTAYLIKNTIMICSEHPQGKNENLHSKAIIDIINDLK